MTGILSSTVFAGSPEVKSQKPTGLQTQGKSTNPIDQAALDAFNGERSGKLTHEEAVKLYMDAFMSASPELRQQHLNNDFGEGKPSLMRSPDGQ
ncbi:MAG: hypothetical protein U1E62_11935 [Alsobacter sp.]